MTNNDIIQDLTDRLTKALDQNYDVVNMETVLSVISDLEGAKITKEQLEATRLAKFINHLRRRTKSENLARRAKNLLKRWREMVGMQQPSNDNTSQIIISNSEAVPCENSFHSTENVKPQADTTMLMMMSHSAAYPHDELNYIKSQKSQGTLTKSSKRSRTSNNNEKIVKNSEFPPNAANVRHQHQPTSFANLIPGSISNQSLDVRENKKFHQLHTNATPATFPSNYVTETYVIDHSSNSSMEGKTASKPLPITTEPIVIDIQDSDSEQEAIKSSTNIAPAAVAAVSSASNCATLSNFPATKTKTKTSSSSKPKKSKKDKSQKNPHHEPYPNQNSSNCVVSQLNDTSSNLYQHILVNDEKSTHSSYPVASMSEILSLSNSSMSTFFPGENDKSAFGTVNNVSRDHKMLPNTELTFAGKFKKNSIMPNTGLATTATASLPPVYDGINDGVSAQAKNSVDPVEIVTSSSKNIVNMYNNSNESSSSHLNKFDMVDVVLSKENNSQKQSTVVEDFKLSNSINSAQLQNNLVSPLNIQTQPTPPETKIPKKRGRKKGSKGVDSLIGKETSLSSQMLMSSFGNGVKKVKTTKELYAEMQSRNQNQQQIPMVPVPSPPTPKKKLNSKPYQMHPDSSCSEFSLLSPQMLDKTVSAPTPANVNTLRDAGDTDSASATSESTDIRKQTMTMDSNSASDFCVTESCPIVAVPNSVLTSLQKDLTNILKDIEPAPSISSIEKSCIDNNVVCSCKVVEVEPTDAMEHNIEDQTNAKSSHNNNNNVHKSETMTEDEKIKVIEKNDNNILKSPESISQSSTKPMKSIFDLDFDDEDDPLNVIKAEVEAAAATTIKSEDNLSHQMDHVEQETFSDEQQSLLYPSHLPQTENAESNLLNFLPTNSIYKIEEDANCIAKDYFEVRTQKITQFHIDALHNCFIPNINGNWNQAVSTEATIATKDTEDVVDVVDVVVPKYGSHETDVIVKDLSHVTFNIDRKMRRPLKTYKYKIPFLGVANLEKNMRYVQKPPTPKAEAAESECEKLENEKHEEVAKIMDISMDNDVAEALDESKGGDDHSRVMLVDQTSPPHSPNQVVGSYAIADNEEGNNDDDHDENIAVIDDDPYDTTTVVLDNITANDSEDHLIPDMDVEMLNDCEKSNNDSDSSSSSTKSSVCSNSSLKMTQQSINFKLRKLQLRQDQKSQVSIKSVNRKRKRKKHSSKDYDELLPTNDNLDCENYHNVRRKKSSNKKHKYGMDNINGDITNDDDHDDQDDEMCHENSALSDVDDDDDDVDVDVDDENEDHDDDDEDDDDDISNDDVYHEVVTKASTANGNNHIVLTIKKTPNKTNFPSKTLPPITPIKIINNNKILPSTKTERETENDETLKETIDEGSKMMNDVKNVDVSESNPTPNAVNSTLNSVTEKAKIVIKSETKKKVHFKSLPMATPMPTPMPMSPTQTKLHDEHCDLFFPEELQVVSANGRQKEFIFSCCESICANKRNKLKEEMIIDSKHNNTFDGSDFQNSENSKIPTSSSIMNENENKEEGQEKCISPGSTVPTATAMYLTNGDEDEEPQMDYKYQNYDDAELPIENNGVLASFNMIYPKECKNVKIKQEDGTAGDMPTPDCKNRNKNDCIVFDDSEIRRPEHIGTPKKYCDECNTYEINDRNYNNKQSIYNNNSNNDEVNNIVNNSSSKKNTSCKCMCKEEESDLKNCANDAATTTALPYKEYRTGIRAVDEDVDDEAGNNCAKIQQFREWHHVLQLRSYNDELLTVLPYVVLD